MKKQSLILLFIHAYLILIGQNNINPHCGFNELRQLDSLTLNNVKQFDEVLKRKLNSFQKDILLRGTPVIIPVVVHIVKHSLDENINDETVYAQIDALNRDFNAHNLDINKVPIEFKVLTPKSGIHFCLTNKDTIGNSTNGIIRIKTNIKTIGLKDSLFDTNLGGSTAWNPDKYLNIWVANTGDYITGMGSYPNAVPTYKSGVVVHPRYFGKNTTSKFGLGRVAVHEVGHYLGLYHTWGKVNDTLCETDDDVADTPPQLSAYFGCPTYPQYSCGLSSLFMNFMDYVDDPCMLMFTEGQMQRMLTTIETYRKGLLDSDVSCSKDLNKTINLFVYPNPTSGQLFITYEAVLNETQADMRILDLLGKTVLQRKLDFSTTPLSIDVSALPSGIYNLVFTIKDKLPIAQKIVVMR